jgi:hypothetical protein
MRRLVCLLGALAVTAGAAGASTVPCGLRGTVYRLPGGACLDDCMKKPLPNATLVFSAPGHAIAKTVTHADGTYRVRLGPGTYSVRMGGDTPLALYPRRAAVVRGAFRQVVFVVGNPKVSRAGR